VCSTLFSATSDSINSVGTIKKISFDTNEGVYIVSVKGDGKLECNTIFMENPPRIALDFPNVKNKLFPNTLEAKENAFVFRVRTSQYAKGKGMVSRLTVDLKSPFDYAVNQTNDGVLLQLRPEQTKPTPPKAAPPSATSPVPASVPAMVPPPAAPAPEIVIGYEDLLTISVFDLPQFSGECRVAGDGTITIPLIGNIEVRGLSKKEAEQKIVNALQAKFVNNANVSVTIKEYKSRQVSVLGAVKSPGPHYILSQITLLQLLSAVGGLDPGAGRMCFIIRPGSPKIEIDLYDLMNNGNQALNIQVYPGDTINIPLDKKTVIYVFGSVKSPGALEFSSFETVTLVSLIARAGGATPEASETKIQIKRKDETGAEIIIKANLKDIIKGKKPDIPLFSGDVVNVPQSFF